MSSFPYRGERYLDADEVDAFVDSLAAAAPDWVRVHTVGHSRQGRAIRLVTVGDHRDDPAAVDRRPAFWLDAGTHATEWTGVMAALFTLSRWVEGLLAGDSELVASFGRSTAHVLPLISPDGLHASMHGTAPMRSTLRPPRSSTVRQGFAPGDLTGDGTLRWMRWRHPAGGWVPLEDHPFGMRPRTVDDDPADAWFVSMEGSFVAWDGVRWVEAAREHGLDLNRNFPVDWSPFQMFGMDAGDYPGSEPESQAVLQAVHARPNIAAALTNHTYTGCLLTPPARRDDALPASDTALMQRLATDLVKGTGYRVYKVYPEFMYDPDKPIIGTWDDTLSATFGICAYTLELWNPYAWAGVDEGDPVDMFRDPSPEVMAALLRRCADDGAYVDWTDVEHPQLGAVQIGGVDELRTIRNPPEPLLAEECERGFVVAERLRRALPRVQATLTVQELGEARQVQLVLENLGALSTSSLQRGDDIGTAPAVTAELVLDDGQQLVDGPTVRQLHPLDGWMRTGFDRNPFYPGLPDRGHRAVARWTVRGEGLLRVRWQAGRAGSGENLHTTRDP
jgi:hypothetical protein